jgi:uncharacterized protein YigE (DUF2233 family)
MFSKERKYLLLRIIFLIVIVLFFIVKKDNKDEDRFITYTVNPQKQNLQFYWKDDSNRVLKSIASLQNWVATKNQILVFAMNGGMYKQDNSPQGLYIEKQQLLSPIDTASGEGNFYMKPNAVFYIDTSNKAFICNADSFLFSSSIKFATQSGPMLLQDGQMHYKFKDGSTRLNIRNGVGILPNNELVFVMSKNEINFYDFANYFKKLDCKNALYLDGFVSRTYLPEKKWLQTDGNFGVMIGVTESKN